MNMRGWRKAGGFVLLVLLAAFTKFEINLDVVLLYTAFAGTNAVVKAIAARAGG